MNQAPGTIRVHYASLSLSIPEREIICVPREEIRRDVGVIDVLCDLNPANLEVLLRALSRCNSKHLVYQSS